MGDDREASHSKHKSKDKHRDRDRSDSKSRREERNGREDRDRGRRDKEKDAEARNHDRGDGDRREREERDRAKTDRVRSERDVGVSGERHRGKSHERSKRGHSEHRDRDDRAAEGRKRDRDERGDHGDRGDHRDKKQRAEVPESREAADARRKAKQEEEQAVLDEEAERRRKRVQAWQEQKAKALAEEEAAARAAAAAAAKWSFEDDDDEEDTAAGGVGRTDGGEDDIDPLDAFMAGNELKAAQQAATPAPAAPAAAAPEEAAAQPPPEEQQQPMEEDDEVDPLDAFMAAEVLPVVHQNGALPPPSQSSGGGAAATATPPASDGVKGEEAAVKVESVKVEEGADESMGAPLPFAAAEAAQQRRKPGGGGARRARRPRYYSSESSGEDSDEDEAESEEEDDEEWVKNAIAGKASKADKLGTVDHSQIDYPPFRRSFYIETQELARMKDEEVAAYRKELDDIKVRGKDIPKPVRNWNQCGLSSRVLEVLKRAGYGGPMPIQAQALPAIMAGRDCLGIAKTGSGKTLAFVLPMLRHIKDQPPLAQGDGPIALIMAPTRELVVQIGKDVRRFSKALSLSCVCAYGGSAVAGQISDLKRGAEVVVCTPGRMIDLLATSSGRITNTRRVTYLVMDEADRMFDMGFEPQISRIVSLVRPDRQTAMFSATFPRSVETLAKRVLVSPIEIQVGGRSVVNADIAQAVEIRPPEERFLRLLEILGEWYERGKALIFVSSQDACDNLFRDLLKVGYPCLSLHGGKDQSDRESTIADFKSDVCNLLVATGVAARGLDVKDLVLVVNYDTPNHHEEYVHRVGRTGRAGNKGTAITFIAPEDERYAPDLVKALRESGAPVPADLAALAHSFNEKRKAGTAQAHGSGYGGSGFKFDNVEEEERRAVRKQTAKDAAKEAGMSSESEDEDDGEIRRVVPGQQQAHAAAATSATASAVQPAPNTADLPPEVQAQVRAAQEAVARLMAQAAAGQAGGAPAVPAPPRPVLPVVPPPAEVNPLVAAFQKKANEYAQQAGIPTAAAAPAPSMPAWPQAPSMWAQPGAPQVQPGPHFEAELEINDFPQHARWKVTHRDTIGQLNELTGAAVTTKGLYQMPGKQLPEGERKLYLLIEGPTETAVKRCKAEIKRILEETTERALRRDAPATGRYNVM